MRVFIFFFAVFALLLAAVDAREDRVARLKRQLLTREAPFNGPTTVTTTRTAETFAGTVVETCTITLTPVTGANNENLVREERKCSTQLVKSSGSGTSTIPATTSSAQNAGTTSVSTVVVTATAAPGSSAAGASTAPAAAAPSSSASAPSSVASSPSAATSVASSAVSGSTTSVASSSSSGPTAEVSPSSSASATSSVTSAASSQVTSSASSSSAATGGPAKEIGTATKSGSSLPVPSTSAAPANAAPSPSGTTTTSVSATAAAAEASASATPFTLPGKKLEVLPIGLGVFAGISVIALIVVGLVTYERTKYRKAFRQRKLAEQGAGMGYNGMSERV